MKRQGLLPWALYLVLCKPCDSFSSRHLSVGISTNGRPRIDVGRKDTQAFMHLMGVPLPEVVQSTVESASFANHFPSWMATPEISISADMFPTLAVASGDMDAFDVLGHDIFVFLAASVFVVPFCKALKVTPVLGFLAMGCLIGPFGGGFIISNSEADI